MSRYKIDSIRPDREECFVGYDTALDSFWIYVARKLITEQGKAKPGYDGHVIKHVGITPGEIDSVENLASLVATYGKMTEEVRTLLEDDRIRNMQTGTKELTAKP